ncbi:kinase-like protein [Auricularia subglabra TFB-10046 SS5]|nr:kinase-like protein [Auricularia subglabra TFB-10046 SS5]
MLTCGRSYKERYTVISQLGEGQHATVWLAEDTQSAGARVAIKVLSTHTSSLQGNLAFEVDVMRKIAAAAASPGSRHLLQLVDEFSLDTPHGEHTCLVTNAFSSKTLQHYHLAAPGKRLPVQFVQHVSRQLLRALVTLHDECQVIHTDIKADNVLFDAAGAGDASSDSMHEVVMGGVDLVLADYGTAIPLSTPRRFPIQPDALRSPEVLLGCEYDTKADIWNAGCLIFELLSGKCLFRPQPYEGFSAQQYHLARILATAAAQDDPNRLSQLFRTGRYYRVFYSHEGRKTEPLLKAPPESLNSLLGVYDLEDDKLLQFLTSMLRIHPHDRATASELLQSAWLAEE